MVNLYSFGLNTYIMGNIIIDIKMNFLDKASWELLGCFLKQMFISLFHLIHDTLVDHFIYFFKPNGIVLVFYLLILYGILES